MNASVFNNKKLLTILALTMFLLNLLLINKVFKNKEFQKETLNRIEMLKQHILNEEETLLLAIK
jgi:hypothetical protein